MALIIKNGTVVNLGSLQQRDIVVENGRIVETPQSPITEVVDATGCYVLPGVIDTHVHFRDPGMTERADFCTESRAAAAGGVTSVVDMPNTNPATTSLELLEQKEIMASKKSLVNYGFMIGATNDNVDDLIHLQPNRCAAIKLFLGSSTGNMLVDNQEVLDKLFANAPMPIVAHCEEEALVKANLLNLRMQYQDTPGETAALHPKVRTTEVCYLSTYKAVARARKFNTRLHIAHLSSATELDLLSNQDISEKNVTAEVTPNHLWFDQRDYSSLGNRIKCNPSIKSNDDRMALWAALYDDRLDTIATDHAPHTLQSKEKPYFDAPSGIPSIQHSLVMMCESFFNSCSTPSEREEMIRIWLPLLVKKMCHQPAQIFGIENRGFLLPGYAADIVVLRPYVQNEITRECLQYKCGWSPLEGLTFHSRVEKTFVNGACVYDAQQGILDVDAKQPLTFSADRSHPLPTPSV